MFFSSGLMPPNHYLAVAIDFLFRTRTRWRADAAVGDATNPRLSTITLISGVSQDAASGSFPAGVSAGL